MHNKTGFSLKLWSLEEKLHMSYNQRFLVVIKPVAKCAHTYENINHSPLKAGEKFEGERK